MVEVLHEVPVAGSNETSQEDLCHRPKIGLGDESRSLGTTRHCDDEFGTSGVCESRHAWLDTCETMLE